MNPEEAEPRIRKYTFDDIIGQSPLFSAALERAKRARAVMLRFLFTERPEPVRSLLRRVSIMPAGAEKSRFGAELCTLPESLLEGILFGTAKGGFTGATDRAGLFEQANGGTLLLDEINSMPYELQSKLLRVLQEDYIRRVGGTRDIPIDVRIIATVNEPPEKLMQEGKPRKDLFIA